MVYSWPRLRKSKTLLSHSLKTTPMHVMKVVKPRKFVSKQLRAAIRGAAGASTYGCRVQRQMSV